MNGDGRLVPFGSPKPGFLWKSGFCFFLYAAFLLGACYKPKDDLSPAPRRTIFVGGKAVTVEVALDEAHRARGLMYRKQLGPDDGMLFVYPRETTLMFWMKNTYVPLSVAFIRADGWIMQIEDMEPLDLVSHRSRMKGKYALEMPKGWFAANGVKVGDVVKIPEDLVAIE